MCIFDLSITTKLKTMTNQEFKNYKVVEIVKFGMLFGYAVKNISNNQIIAEYSEEERWKADSKDELKNALNENKGF